MDRWMGCLASCFVLATAATGQGQLIDLSTWQVIQYETNFQPDANWLLQNNNTTALQAVNADPSILLSDFDAASQEILGTLRVETAGDDDFIGFVFGYQDRGQFYLFDWKQSSQSFAGFAEVGMSLKVVQMPAGQDPDDDDLWTTAGTANTTLLAHNTIPWAEFTDYEFELRFVPGTIEITVTEAGQVLEQWNVSDSTYTDGLFGFYNYSQDSVRYNSFTQQGIPEFYCTAKTNSQGCTPALATTGFASLSATSPFTIEATMLINSRNGVLVYGLDGPAAMPFGGGVLCVGPPLRWTSVAQTLGNVPPDDCSGGLMLDFNAYVQSAGAPSVVAGDQVHAQFFYRDPQHADGTGFGLTGGVSFVIVP